MYITTAEKKNYQKLPENTTIILENTKNIEKHKNQTIQKKRISSFWVGLQGA